jgi:hypothetical protein
LDRDYRQILYNLGSDVMRLAGPRADLLNRYGVEVVVMNMFEYVTGAEYPLPLALATAPAESGWRLVYDDPRAVVFWRNPPTGTPVFNDPYARVVTHADTECSEHIQHDPSTPACALALAKNWAAGGGVEQALRMLRLYFMSSSSPEADAVDLWHRLGGGPLPRR